ncbi:MAG: GTP 3',8-cyclase MoaA [Eubacterium sp.]|nr:GTP 3',8-cyclase MoaA [Eubacterium sp.]
MLDNYGRQINYMRISITDKCNLRCRYCMPEGVEILPMTDLLSLEEITAVCRQASRLGIDRIKITGGEPLVRKGVVSLVKMVKELPEIRQVTMTTNGVLLKEYLPELKAAGLDAVNISLDTLNRETYQKITGKDHLNDVLASVEAAIDSGLRVKINTVLMRGVNDREWTDIVELAKNRPLDVRFIEMMPIGAGADFSGVSNRELLDALKRRFPEPSEVPHPHEARQSQGDPQPHEALQPCETLQPHEALQIREDPQIHGNGPAVYYKLPGYQGSIGFISAIHGKFCGSCNRIRMTATGDLKPCLCYGTSVNIREILRQQGEEAAAEILKEVIRKKPEAHCFEKKEDISETNKMIAIGG